MREREERGGGREGKERERERVKRLDGAGVNEKDCSGKINLRFMYNYLQASIISQQDQNISGLCLDQQQQQQC